MAIAPTMTRRESLGAMGVVGSRIGTGTVARRGSFDVRISMGMPPSVMVGDRW